jgi:DNA-directed RNA polymerase subunit F
MIIDKKPLSLAELKEYVKDLDGKEDLMKYLKLFGKASNEKAIKIKKEVKALNNPKIREDCIVKVIDFLPEDQEEINKIFVEANLNTEEADALAEIVKR